MDENNFEKFPGGGNIERAVPEEQDFGVAMNGVGAAVPEFTGEQFGIANMGNEYYGEGGDSIEEQNAERNEGIADAAALINYGLNAAARNMGVELLVQKIKSFDASGMDDPIKGFYEYLGIDNSEERKDLREENMAARSSEAEFREGVNAPSREKSVEGAFAAIEDMKELIAEVEGADPRYEALREGARSAGKGYFEFAVSEYGVRGLTELFAVLGRQREKDEEAENMVTEDEANGNADNVVKSVNPENIEDNGGIESDMEEHKAATLNPEILGK